MSVGVASGVSQSDRYASGERTARAKRRSALAAIGERCRGERTRATARHERSEVTVAERAEVVRVRHAEVRRDHAGRAGHTTVATMDFSMPGGVKRVDHALSRVARKGYMAVVQDGGEDRPEIFDPEPDA